MFIVVDGPLVGENIQNSLPVAFVPLGGKNKLSDERIRYVFFRVFGCFLDAVGHIRKPAADGVHDAGLGVIGQGQQPYGADEHSGGDFFHGNPFG